MYKTQFRKKLLGKEYKNETYKEIIKHTPGAGYGVYTCNPCICNNGR